MPSYLDRERTLISRRARKAHKCRGNGAGGEYRKFADLCPGTIAIGDRYVEYVGEVPAFQSGTAHCVPCYEAFFLGVGE